MGVAPAALPCARVAGDRLLGNVGTVCSVPCFELTFPTSGLSLGVDMQQCPGQAEQLLASNRFWVQGELGFDIEPSMKPTALDDRCWPNSLDGPEHTLLAVTDYVGWCGDER